MKPPTFSKLELWHNPKLVIRKSDTHGWGVFTTEDIIPYEILEESPYFEVWDEEVEDAYEVTRYSYGMSNNCAAVCLGFAGLYNHSETPNADSCFNEYHGFITHFSTELIKADSEIYIDYGIGDPAIFTEEHETTSEESAENSPPCSAESCANDGSEESSEKG